MITISYEVLITLIALCCGAWFIELKSAAIHYFENKKQKSAVVRREWVRTYIPITISSIALIKSFLPEITSLVKSIMQLLK